MRVLTVDDDPFLRTVLGRFLRSWGYEVSSAEDGVGAWAILRRPDTPPLLIVDWDMPGMSGPEVVRLLRNTDHGRDVYVVMLTGRMEKSDLIAGLEAGVDDYLTKPFEAREVQIRLARASAAARERAATTRELSADGITSASTIAGRYRVERRIGEGGMADVWLGTHLALEIPVAIKFMKPLFATRPDYASFEREARSAAKLRSQHVCQVYDHGVAANGLPYLVTEYLAGESLADRIINDGPLSPAAVVSIVSQISRALERAHEQGLVHAM